MLLVRVKIEIVNETICHNNKFFLVFLKIYEFFLSYGKSCEISKYIKIVTSNKVEDDISCWLC